MAETKQRLGIWMQSEGPVTDIFIFGAISTTTVKGEASLSDFKNQMMKCETDRIRLNISSPGGDPFAGLAMFNVARSAVDDGKSVETVNQGMAASAGSLVFMAGDKRFMSRGSRLMIHEARSGIFGTVSDLEKQFPMVIEQLTETNQSASEIYYSRSNMTLGQVKQAMSKELWMTDKQAVQRGFATAKTAHQHMALMCDPRFLLSDDNRQGFEYSEDSDLFRDHWVAPPEDIALKAKPKRSNKLWGAKIARAKGYQKTDPEQLAIHIRKWKESRLASSRT